MSNKDKVSYRDITMMIKDDIIPETPVKIVRGADEIIISVKKKLTAEEAAMFVETAAYLIIHPDENGAISYNPAFRDYAIRYCVYSYLTNIKVSKSIDRMLPLLESDEIYNAVEHEIDGDVVEMIYECVDEAVEFRKQNLPRELGAANALSGVDGLLNTIAEKINETDIGELFGKIKEEAPEIYEKIVNENSAG